MGLSSARRRGQALLEFAVIAFILYLFLAATLELGRATFGVQTIQAAADLAAREISRTPLSPGYTFTDALNDRVVRERIFDERLLVIELPEDYDLDEMFRKFPVVNQQLRTLMIIDRTSPGRTYLRYPGTIVNKGNEKGIQPDEDFQQIFGVSDSGLRIQIPVVTYGANSESIIRWASVIEEIDPGAFTLEPRPDNEQRQGFVGVRINYPFQAASLVNYQVNPNDRFAPNGANATIADDNAMTAPPLSGGRQLQPNGGRYGLGSMLAGVPNKGGQRVRPFRRLLTGQAIYRREVFAP